VEKSYSNSYEFKADSNVTSKQDTWSRRRALQESGLHCCYDECSDRELIHIHPCITRSSRPIQYATYFIQPNVHLRHCSSDDFTTNQGTPRAQSSRAERPPEPLLQRRHGRLRPIKRHHAGTSSMQPLRQVSRQEFTAVSRHASDPNVLQIRAADPRPTSAKCHAGVYGHFQARQ
jgi:hypothetical protein